MEVIIKISTNNIQFQKIFTKYANFLNYSYQRGSAPAYFEIIEGKLLWILENMELFHKLQINSPKTIENIRNHSSRKNEIKQELINYSIIENQPIIFLIESVNHPLKEIQLGLKFFFSYINPSISISSENGNICFLKFPNLNAFVDYLDIITCLG